VDEQGLSYFWTKMATNTLQIFAQTIVTLKRNVRFFYRDITALNRLHYIIITLVGNRSILLLLQ